jgi:hypothetical protein
VVGLDPLVALTHTVRVVQGIPLANPADYVLVTIQTDASTDWGGGGLVLHPARNLLMEQRVELAADFSFRKSIRVS